MPSTVNTLSAKADTPRQRRRVERRCIAPVVEALHAGQISVKGSKVFLQLSPRKQKAELERRLNKARQREARHRMVASAIRGYLDGLNGGRVDLIELSNIIRETLA
jgi:hypothetical protein